MKSKFLALASISETVNLSFASPSPQSGAETCTLRTGVRNIKYWWGKFFLKGGWIKNKMTTFSNMIPHSVIKILTLFLYCSIKKSRNNKFTHSNLNILISSRRNTIALVLFKWENFLMTMTRPCPHSHLSSILDQRLLSTLSVCHHWCQHTVSQKTEPHCRNKDGNLHYFQVTHLSVLC